jgi:hypothetical protein
MIVAKTIHCSERLSLHELAFDLANVKRNWLTYITLSRIQTKKKLFLLIPFQHEIFYVNSRVHRKMNKLKIVAIWIPLLFQLENLHKFSCNYTSFEYNFFTPTLRKHQP